ncbi:MAG: carbohydrate ABC transporter permease [Alicyclobacillus herbarius]|uniref:carbohydrate ABC transporter permease n=1 Tax=Alicyclobacillus herbarius TaxID=122960 RepID=UPI002354C949|nr:carbohydrate ABC transporter permease [Alicyclobacillus herbarius]MCL6632572.1 carbohydrate ABC transporter permease [Alicyclobacillus herbarius]
MRRVSNRMLHSTVLNTINYVFLTVACVVIAIPFLWMFATSLKPDSEVFSIPLKWIGSHLQWTNYTRAVQFFPFGRFVFNDLLVSVLGTSLTLITSSLSAYAFSRLNFKSRDQIFAAYLLTLMVPQQVIVVPMFLLMKYIGWVNTYWALILPWAFTAFGTFLMRQFYMTIPFELDEAARIDGCSHFRIYWRIILPLAKPGFAALAVFTFISYWNNLLWPLIVTNDKSKFTLPLGLQAFHGQYGTQWNLLMAGAALAVVPSLIVYLVAQRYIVEGISFSGLGGR